jgi:N-acetylmuramoyl-L-alanine amidase
LVLGLALAASAIVVRSASAADAVFTVAVDPGHGGTNLGAAGLERGVYEKRITLAIARGVRKRVGRSVRVVLCRERDELVPIRARVRCANEARADLFLSLHANASPLGPRRGTQRGFELFVLPLGTADSTAALEAARSQDDAEAAWRSYRTHALIEAAVESAKRIEWELADALGKDRNRGLKQEGASLDVLEGLTMPGILIEMGFLDHVDEGRELASDEGQDKIARALARAIGDLAARARRARTDPTITAP